MKKKPSRPVAQGAQGAVSALQRQLDQASVMEQQGQLQQALSVLNTALAQFPREPIVYLRMGNLLAGAGQWGAAQSCYAACCQLQPANAVAQHNRGVSLQELGRVQDAITAFERAVAANPQYAQAYHSLGLAYQMAQVPQAAIVAFECAMQLDGKDARFPVEHARTQLHMGHFAQALAELEGLASSAVVLNLKGIALKNLRRPDEALAAFSAALQLNPHLAEALNNRGNLFLQSRQFSKALVDLDAALALQSDQDWLQGTRLYAASHVFAWDGFEAERMAIEQAVRQGARAIQPLALQTLVDDPELQQLAARIWTQASCPPARQPEATPPSSGEKIRIAYVSKDFRAHPVSFLIAEVIELHDRERFEVIAINYGAAIGNNDAMQTRLRAGFDQFLDVEQLSEQAIAQACRALGVDIAVDLTGFTDGARSAIFAWRAAPVQVSYLGYLGTSGTQLYDYLLADAHIIPAEFRAHYDERIAYLPSYQANDRQRPQPDAEPALAPPGFVFCCFNNPCKITPTLFTAWMQILEATPGSVLWLLAEDEQAPINLRHHAQALGVDPQRLVFAQRSGREAYLSNLAAADLFLDTLPYNAGTTASDALWVGLPVLTQPGKSFAGRVAASLLKAIDLPELIAQDLNEYVALAIQLAQEPERIAALKAKLIAKRSSSRLFDAPRFTRSLEAAFTQMHETRVAGLTPQDIHVSG